MAIFLGIRPEWRWVIPHRHKRINNLAPNVSVSAGATATGGVNSFYNSAGGAAWVNRNTVAVAGEHVKGELVGVSGQTLNCAGIDDSGVLL